MEFKDSNSLQNLRKINTQIPERHFHEHTHILYDIRTLLGEEEKTYLEIGSYVGSSACLMMTHTYKTKVYSVDPCQLNPSHYQGQINQKSTILNNVSNNTSNKDSEFKLITGLSCDKLTLDKIKDLKIDILFIDGDHKYQAVIDDFNNYVNLVSEGGYIIFDDYLDNKYSPQVKSAVDKIVPELDLTKFEIINTPRNKSGATFIAPSKLKYLNEFIIRKKENIFNEYKLFAIVIPTYMRKNGLTPTYIRKVAKMLNNQTYQNYHVFLIGDDYKDQNEFLQLTSLFPSDKIYYHNNNNSYRENYFNNPKNKWAIGGIMALEYGVKKAKEMGFKYYLHLDDDDDWSLNKLKIIKENIINYPYADFIFHGSKYKNFYLPREHNNNITLMYDNLLPKSCNIVHSSNCLNLNEKCYKIFADYICNVMNNAEKIKNKEIHEFEFAPFDAELINVLRRQDINFLYIPQILSNKETDVNIPQ